MRAKASEAVSKVADVAQEAGRQAKQAASSLASDAQQKAKGLLNMQVTAGAELAGHVAAVRPLRCRRPRPERPAARRARARGG
jgi:TRAP-type C4-dicarboxylate transport system substrate-binding protein